MRYLTSVNGRNVGAESYTEMCERLTTLGLNVGGVPYEIVREYCDGDPAGYVSYDPDGDVWMLTRTDGRTQRIPHTHGMLPTVYGARNPNKGRI